MIQDIIPGTEEKLNEGPAVGYIGFDPTSDSLHIGSLVQILIFKKMKKIICLNYLVSKFSK